MLNWLQCSAIYKTYTTSFSELLQQYLIARGISLQSYRVITMVKIFISGALGSGKSTLISDLRKGKTFKHYKTFTAKKKTTAEMIGGEMRFLMLRGAISRRAREVFQLSSLLARKRQISRHKDAIFASPECFFLWPSLPFSLVNAMNLTD